MHKSMRDIMNAGAQGVEIIFSGKLPSQRAKSWRVFAGHLKKCGEYAFKGVSRAMVVARLKMGVIGIKIRIALPNVKLPDSINLTKEEEEKEEAKKPVIQDKKLVQLKRKRHSRRSRRSYSSGSETKKSNSRSSDSRRSNRRTSSKRSKTRN